MSYIVCLSCGITPFWNFWGPQHQCGIFWGLIFGAGIVWVLLEALGIFGGLDFWLHSIIPITWNPKYPPWGYWLRNGWHIDQYLTDCRPIYCWLHLPVNALTQNMFSLDVKRLSSPSQHCSKGRWSPLISKKGRNYQKGVPLSTICGIKWKNLRRIIFLRSWAKIRAQFQNLLCTTLHIWAWKLESLTPETQTFDVTWKHVLHGCVHG